MSSYIIVREDNYEVRAVSTLNSEFKTDIPAVEFLNAHARSGQYSSNAKSFMMLFDRYAKSLRSNLTADLLHEVDKSEKISEFIKGDLRVFCFFDGNHAVLTHGCIKKGQKVDRTEITRAISLRKIYKT